jgi:DUF1680 family protein
MPFAQLLILTCLLLPASAFAAEQPGKLTPVPFPDVKIRDEFWAPRMETNRVVTIKHDFEMCEKTGRISNFEVAGKLKQGQFQGIHYDDSDVYKVIEGASYSLTTHPDPQLEKYLDGLIAKIAAAQLPDGYLYTFHTIKDGGRERYTNLKDGHELYCGGHMIEAAVAHYRATGKKNFLDVATRFADQVDSVFGPGKRHGVDGHEEIELALFKLADVTGQQKYADLARFFVAERGNAESGRPLLGKYYQDFAPVTSMKEVVGHAVRMTYLLCAMTDVAARTGDDHYAAAVDRLWADLVGTKMYITGGIGARHDGEAFGDAFELPNESAYNETCAAVGNALWNHRMNLLHGDAKYADTVERIVYNGFLSGVSLQGDKFFYVNPLASRGGHHRKEWYGTACCPVNVVRFLPSLPGYVYATSDDGVYVNLYAQSDATVPLKGQTVRISQETRYPWDGRIKLTVHPEKSGPFSLFLRIPEWVEQGKATLTVNGERMAHLPVNKGYAPVRVVWKDGDTVELDLPMPVRRVKADPRVEADKGRVALQRGPVVYTFEAADNNGRVSNLSLPPDAELKTEHRPDLLGGVTVVKGKALARTVGGGTEPVEFTAIPYYAWDHRKAGEMAVWIPEDPALAVAPNPPTIANTSTASASHLNPSDTLDALADGDAGKGPADQSIPRFTWWDHKGGDGGEAEWVQYTFREPKTVSGVEVHWFDDTRTGGGCALPRSWRVLYRDGNDWKPVKEVAAAADQRVGPVGARRFEPVKTNALRLEVQLQDGKSGGVLEWSVAE